MEKRGFTNSKDGIKGNSKLKIYSPLPPINILYKFTYLAYYHIHIYFDDPPPNITAYQLYEGVPSWCNG